MPKITDDAVASRRRQILQAALTCYQRSGFFETQMKDIAAEAGISVGLLYRYFADKKDLLAAVMESSRAADRAGRNAHAEGLSAAEGLRTMASAIIQLHTDPAHLPMLRGNIRAYGEATRLEAAELDVMRPALVEAVEDFGGLIRRGQEEGDFDPDLDPEAVARMMIGMIVGSNLLRVFDDGFDPEAHGQLVDRMIKGLSRGPD